MKYTFKDVLLQELYDTACVIFTAGPYTLFNNMVADKIREGCRPKNDIFGETDSALMEEWRVEAPKEGEEQKLSLTNIVDLDTFFSVVEMPSLNGKWYCSVGLAGLRKKQKDKLMSYIKAPSKNGTLVVFTMDWKEYKELLWNKVIQYSKDVHIIQLSFPSRQILIQLVRNIFKSKGLTVGEEAASLFVMRLSNAYDEYEPIIDGIALEKPGITMDKAEMQQSLKGVDNYILDDLIAEMLIPMTSSKASGRRYIYKMLGSLLSTMTARELVSKLKYKVADYIEFRIAINNGTIPVKIRYFYNDVVSKLPEESKLAKINEWTFRKMAETASQTSLRDWMYIQLMLHNTSNTWDEAQQERVLYSMVHRSTLNKSRLLNDIGIMSTLEEKMSIINTVQFSEESLTNIDYTIDDDIENGANTEVIIDTRTGELVT